MNILEAIKSGKRFRRKPSIPGTVSWIGPLDVTTHWDESFFLDDILADDWEVEEKQVTVTESAFKAAWVSACKSSGYHDDFAPHGWLYTALKVELGL